MSAGVARVRYRVKGRPGVYVLPQQPEAEPERWLMECAREHLDNGFDGFALVSFRMNGKDQTSSRASYFWPASRMGPLHLMPEAVKLRLVERVLDGSV